MSVSLPIDNIRRRADARALDDSVLAGLSESIEVVGLINPIRVRKIGDRYEVIAGGHRLTACDLLGLREIDCIVVDDDDLHAELAMIDENLCRAELSPGDRVKQTARRKAIYLELHPDTAHGANLAGAGVAKSATPETERFSAATAKLTGQSERTVRLDAERGEKVTDEVIAIIRGTKLDTGVYLDKLKRMTPNEQVHAAKRDLAHINKTERGEASVPRPGGIAGRIAPKAAPPSATFDELRSALGLLGQLKPDDYISLCPPNKRAAMCQRLSGLVAVFQQVMEDATQ